MCDSRGNKVTVTAWCYVYRALHPVVIKTVALVKIYEWVELLSEDYNDIKPKTESSTQVNIISLF